MNTTHTPGPWHIAEEHENVFGEQVTRREICSQSEWGDLVCLNLNSVGKKYPCSEPNARLIAAAPDLLAAAKAALWDFNSIMPPELVERFGAAKMMLRAAIARGEGGGGL